MRNRKSAIISGLGIIAVLLALTPDPVAARGGRGGGGFAGRGAMGGGFAGRGGGGFAARGAMVRGGGFAGRGAVGAVGFRRAAWGGGPSTRQPSPAPRNVACSS